MKTVKEIFAPYEKEGRSTMILTGRSIYDLECDTDGTISSVIKMVADYARGLGMAMVRYSLSEGIVVPYNFYDKADAATIRKALSDNGITNVNCSSGNCQASQELVDILRGIAKLASASASPLLWHDGQQVKFLFVFEFASDMMPDATSVNQLITRELIYKVAFSRQFQNNGNMMILTDEVEGKIDSQIRGLLYNKFLPYPDYEDKLTFIKGLHDKYPMARYAGELNDSVVANLSSSTPNRGLDLTFRASHISGDVIEAKSLVEQKIKDVQAISEETITMLDTARVKDVELKGVNTRVPMEFLKKQAEGLRTADKSMHSNVLLMGAPGTGKTDLAMLTAYWASVPIYQLSSPKAGIVGETERRAALQARVFASITPSLGFIDEITEAMPMQRANNLDSGASDAVMQALLNVLSDNTREGSSLLIATTNCGFKMGSAMRDRFVIVPVIMPTVEDMPEIICSIAGNAFHSVLDPNDSDIVTAASIFYAKHAMPRRIRSALKLAVGPNGLTAKSVLRAAEDVNPMDEKAWLSAVYADLCAISLTVSKTLLPWYGCEHTYPFPDYIKNILDENHEVDSVKLNNEISKLQPYVNV